uniref:Uncharacterized protein n=1 Tax=Setaria italica TaxID=4555 RepID=K3YLA6_SETIT
MAKGKGKVDGDGPSRERTINWDDGQTKSCWIVDRHFRHYKEHWKYVSKALSNSGNVFDGTRCMGGYFRDTCMNDYDDSESDDSQGLNDMSGNALPEDLNGDDSNTLPSPLSNKPGGESSSCTSQVGTKRPRGSKSPSKKPKKPKSHFSESTEQLNSTLLSLQKFLNAPAPQVPQPPNPHASLWERLEAMTITTYNKITVCQYLAHNDRKGLRDFLSSASDTTLQTWVYKFLT